MSPVERLARLAMRQAWRRGIVGGSPAWTVVGGVAAVGYLAGRALRRQPDVVFSEKLLPGESFLVTHEGRS